MPFAVSDLRAELKKNADNVTRVLEGSIKKEIGSIRGGLEDAVSESLKDQAALIREVLAASFDELNANLLVAGNSKYQNRRKSSVFSGVRDVQSGGAGQSQGTLLEEPPPSSRVVSASGTSSIIRSSPTHTPQPSPRPVQNPLETRVSVAVDRPSRLLARRGYHALSAEEAVDNSLVPKVPRKSPRQEPVEALDDEAEEYSVYPSESCEAGPLMSKGPPQNGDETLGQKLFLPWEMILSFVQSSSFDYCIALIILFSTVSAGIETESMARHGMAPMPVKIANRIFIVIFAAELMLRAICYGRTFWMFLVRNILDAFIILFQFFDLIWGIWEWCHGRTHRYHIGLSALRVIRVLRLIRIIKLTSVLKVIGELRMLIVCIMDSLRALGWTICLMLLITYMFAIFLTDVVFKYLEEHPEVSAEDRQDLMVFYATVGTTMFSLYEAMLDGVNWSEIVSPLTKCCGLQYSVLVVIYMTCSLIALMNIVTSFFVTAAMKHAEDDKKQVLMMQMRAFFSECDVDGSGTITWDEFQNHVEHPQMMEYLQEIDLHPDQAKALFHLLDTGGEADVGIDEIVASCIRLHGPAKSIDLSTFMRESESAWRTWSEHSSYVNSTLLKLVTFMRQNGELQDRLLSLLSQGDEH
eukprot:TRINITY_DN76735_c0_g1_i1.p1 TRINITY_DN76735_c0_g1~~TRINITY_DN76735_c0_g1_i1.p1  ORF type:complete len:657 (+),score=100.81 TRINITY_DN76735_c0_g1_i1:58-1971(+)